MTGSSIFDYVHQSDHGELAEQLGVTLAHQRLSGADKAGGAHGPGAAQAPQGPAPNIPDGKPCK